MLKKQLFAVVKTTVFLFYYIFIVMSHVCIFGLPHVEFHWDFDWILDFTRSTNNKIQLGSPCKSSAVTKFHRTAIIVDPCRSRALAGLLTQNTTVQVQGRIQTKVKYDYWFFVIYRTVDDEKLINSMPTMAMLCLNYSNWTIFGH